MGGYRPTGSSRTVRGNVLSEGSWDGLGWDSDVDVTCETACQMFFGWGGGDNDVNVKNLKGCSFLQGNIRNLHAGFA